MKPVSVSRAIELVKLGKMIKCLKLVFIFKWNRNGLPQKHYFPSIHSHSSWAVSRPVLKNSALPRDWLPAMGGRGGREGCELRDRGGAPDVKECPPMLSFHSYVLQTLTSVKYKIMHLPGPVGAHLAGQDCRVGRQGRCFHGPRGWWAYPGASHTLSSDDRNDSNN